MGFPLEKASAMTRRTFFGQVGLGLGAMALNALLESDGHAQRPTPNAHNPLAPKKPHHRARVNQRLIGPTEEAVVQRALLL